MRADYPYEETLISLTASGAKMFKHLLDTYDYQIGLSIINTQTMTPVEKTTLSKGYKDLRERNLVKRVRKFTYLINPNARIHAELYEDLLVLWNDTP